MKNQSFSKLDTSLKRLKKKWPKPFTQEIRSLFKEAQENLKILRKETNGLAKRPKGGNNFFDFVSLIHPLIKNQDLVFLSRQLSYHIITTDDLPEAFGSGEEAVAVLTELLLAISKQASFGSQLEISLKGMKLREGPAIQVRFDYRGKNITEEQRQKVIEEIYGLTLGGKLQKKGIAYAKMLLRRVRGQFWLEFPKENQMAIAFYWPAFDTTIAKLPSVYGTYQCNILLTDYTKIRQRFGIVRARKLVAQIETLIRSLVRVPIDMVIAFPEKGMITTIYESQEGAAATVANRISNRLKKEAFRLGKKNVTPKFHYHLSYLA